MRKLLISNSKKYVLSVLFLILLLSPYVLNAQDFGEIDSTLNDWKDQIKTIAKTFIAIAAIVGAVWVFFKMQNDEGGSGRKALMAYLGALMFAALVWIIIEAMLS